MKISTALNNINTVSSTVNAAGIEDNVVGKNIVYGYNDDPNMPNLEEIVHSNDDEDVGAETDITNLDTHIPVSPIPTTRIHKDHPAKQIIRDIHSAPQTRRMTKSVTEHEAMQEELLQFKLQQVWTLVDLPYGKRAIGIKWIYKNKKDERGIVVRNKAILVAQGYTQEEGIDYDEVFAPVARIEAIRLFLAYAIQKTLLLYQRDVRVHFYDDEDVGAEADMTNLDTHILVSPIPTTKIHKDHPIEQIIGDIHSAPQTRRMNKSVTDHVEPNKKVRTLVDLPYGKRAIGTKWVYRNKKDERGIVVRNKARLVVQGYTQEEGIDYDEVFSPVARIEAIRLFLAYASFKDFVVYQMDVKSAFLYGKIEEEVYVCQPTGFEDPKFPDRVYKVEKALYDLHQAPRVWVKGDILLVQMSSMGELAFFLGLQVTQKDDGIFISQDKYVDEILNKFGFSTVKTASIPMETSKPLMKDENAEDVGVHLYRSMIGSLMYLTSSRPDIMFVVCACARFQVTPKVLDLHDVKRIFRYLKGNPQHEVLWIQNQMLDYGYNFMNTKIFIDNKSTICIVKNLMIHSKTKNIDIRHHFIRDSYEKRLIQVIKIHIDHNVADLLTKAFDVSRFQFLTASIGMLNL
ncbi:putative ribonuclease H-like domain-containing protein [Tanacetum coccineum]